MQGSDSLARRFGEILERLQQFYFWNSCFRPVDQLFLLTALAISPCDSH